LSGENLGQKLRVVEFPIITSGLEEGLSVIIPAVQIAVLVPIQRFSRDEFAKEFDAIFDGFGSAFAECLKAECAGAGQGPLIVGLVAIQAAKTAILRLLALDVIAGFVDGAVQPCDLQAGELGSFQSLILPSSPA
jgi:C4-dicarboxylate transporter